MKENENYYSQSRPEVAKYIPKNINRILDVGCGEGSFLKLVKEKTGAETWGIELENIVFNIAKKDIDKSLFGKIEDIINELPSSSFDCISFNDVLEHLVEPTEVLRSIIPKLSAKGFIIASIPSVRELSTLFELIVKKDWKYKDFGVLDSTHIRFFTKKSMKRMFENAGYKVIKIEGINGNKSWKFRLFNLITLFLFNDTKYMQYVCIAVKK